MITVTDLTKDYLPAPGAVAVLRGVSFGVEAGRFVCLMGASGSGKTTLLNLIAGLDTPTSGTVTLDGTELARLGDGERSAFRLRRLGFVFQFFNLLPHLTVLENVALPLLLLGRGEAEAHGAAEALAAEVGLTGKLGRQAHQLSGGEMQRVGIARALVHRPVAVLADEPTGNLDSKTGAGVLELLRETAARHGTTVLLATHDAQAAGMADEVVRMVDGRLEGREAAGGDR